ncbi:MAG: SGNH/GDSL hydrolase family protein [Clostridia bacterium]|nr:SGNH/GDSL hydrolase family protein [Clostridia bacterium]
MILEGKIIDFLGDSITEGVGVTDRANNRFDKRIERDCKIKATYNYGIGGTRIAHQIKASSEKPRWDLCFCGRAYDLNKNADIIVVFGGTNDYGHGDAPFGTLEDTTPETYCGAVYWLMNFLKTSYPNAQTVFMTPAHRKGDYKASSNSKKAPDCKPLVEYVNAMVAQGEKLGIPVLNLFEKLGIDPNNEEERNAYTIDGLHFNDAGHEFLANALIKFLKEL